MTKEIVYITSINKYTSFIEKFIYRIVTLGNHTDLKFKVGNEYIQTIKTITPMIEKDLGISIDDLYLGFRHDNKVISGLKLHTFISYILVKFGEVAENVSYDDYSKCRKLEENIGKLDLSLEIGFEFTPKDLNHQLDIRRKTADLYGSSR